MALHPGMQAWFDSRNSSQANQSEDSGVPDTVGVTSAWGLWMGW